MSTTSDPIDYTEEVKTYLRQVLPDNEQYDNLYQRLITLVNGTPRDRKLFIFQGTGGNGKTTLLNFIRTLMGNDCITISPAILHSNRLEDLTCLINKKIVILEEDTDLSENWGRLKELLCENHISYRRLYQQDVETFSPEFDIIICVNDVTKIPDSLLRRCEIIPFPVCFHHSSDQKTPNFCEIAEKWGASLRYLSPHN